MDTLKQYANKGEQVAEKVIKGLLHEIHDGTNSVVGDCHRMVDRILTKLEAIHPLPETKSEPNAGVGPASTTVVGKMDSTRRFAIGLREKLDIIVAHLESLV